MTTMGSDSDGASSLCSRTLTSPQPAIPGDRSERQRDLQDIDDGGDYSGDCAATVYDPCGANHFISDDDNTDFGSCDDTTDPTTMGTQHDTVDSVTRGVFLSECNSEVCDVADGIDSEGPFNGNLSTDADTNRTQLGDLFQEVLNEKIVVSKGEMLLMIFKHAIKSNLSFTAMVSLIEMVNMFFERPVLPHSRYQLGKLFSEHGTEMSFHFICGKCSTVHEVAQSYAQSSHCQKCGWALASSVNSESFFVLLDVPSQLRKVLKNCSFLDLTKPLSQSSNLSDICDGELYRKFVSATVDEGHRISFTLNADGTPLFSSSNTSIWPIQLLVNEVPIMQRGDKLVLAALWFGKKKPDMSIFLDVFVEKMEGLAQNGFVLDHEGQPKLFKAYCICCAVDSVARAPMQGVMQFNAYYGCNWCLQKGERIAGTTRYPVEKNEPPERSEQEIMEDAETALQQDHSERGVKTVSPLLNLPHFDIVWGFVPDYMHSILLGVARQFLEMWMADAQCDFYIGKHQRTIDERLTALAPPREVRRLPRATKERKWWKAKEFENWVLFYSLPVLQGILNKSCISHWACLVEVLHILLSRNISLSHFQRAEELLLEFHVMAEAIYGKKCMTFNLHQLVHIAKSVKHWGPLWAHSAFPFEAGNGALKSMVKAANGVPHQICRAHQVEDLIDKLSSITTDRRVLDYCMSLDKRATQKTVVAEDIRLFGRGVPYRSDASTDLVQYTRMLMKGTVYTSHNYSSKKKTNSSVVRLADQSYAVIETILMKQGEVYIAARRLHCSAVKYSTLVMEHLVKVQREAATTTLVSASEIFSVCAHMQVGPNIFISPVPSSFTM